MEIWFIAASIGAIFAGFSNFCFKVASRRSYNAELFTLIGGMVSILAVSVYVFIVNNSLIGYGWLGPVTIFAGAIAATGGILLQYFP